MKHIRNVTGFLFLLAVLLYGRPVLAQPDLGSNCFNYQAVCPGGIDADNWFSYWCDGGSQLDAQDACAAYCWVFFDANPPVYNECLPGYPYNMGQCHCVSGCTRNPE